MKPIFYIQLLLILSCRLLAQSPSFIFHNIGERQGLSANFSNCILRDSRGMLWVGTVNGLSRFDGVHFNNFNAGKDSTTFINNIIIDLCEDKQGNIWGGTASGIFCYKVAKNVFLNYIPPTYDFARGVKNIICDRNGNIWATSEWNILKLNKKKNEFEEIGPITKQYDSLGAYSVRENGCIEDPSGLGLWFATRRGLHFYNTIQDKFYSYKNMPGDAIFTNHSVAALSLSKTGNIWFFDNVTKDIISFDPKTHQILQRINVNAEIPNAFATTLFEDNQQQLWFSSWNNKMAVIDYRKNTIITIAYNSYNPLSIAGDLFWDVWEDEDNNIWIATEGGISKCNYSKNVYNIIPIVEQVPEFKQSSLGAFTIDPDDNSWWIAADGDVNVIHYEPESGKYDFFDFPKAQKNSKGLLPNAVFQINYIDSQLYVCTHNGVWELNKRTKQITPFEKKFDGLPALDYQYFEVHGNDVWFMTKAGHVKWNKITKKAILIKATVEKFSDGQRYSYGRIYFDNSKKPWFIPAFGWIAYINNKNEVVSKYYIKNKARELSSYIVSVVKDKAGNFWMASSGAGGLYKYNPEKDDIKLYDQSDGIPAHMRSLIIDEKDRIWIGAGNKFSIFSTTTKSISNFILPLYENKIDFVNEFEINSNKDIFATFNKDIVKFMPDRMNLKPLIIVPLISTIKISGKEKLITVETKLKLEPDENSLEFSFGSLINNEIFPYSFEYILEGFDKKWMTAYATAIALYNNLQSGNYVFKVRAVAKDKSWQTPERTLQLLIRTPFYKSAWFLLLMAALLITGLVFFYRFKIAKQKQIHSLENKSQALEKEKTMIQYESLKQQLNPHFLFNSLTSLRSLIKSDSKAAAGFLDGMSKIYRYVLKSGAQELVLLRDEIEFVTTFTDLQQVRFGEGLQVDIKVDEAAANRFIAPVVLQNMVENAIKHNTTSTDEPLVIKIFSEENHVVIRNNLQRYRIVETSNKSGITSLKKLYSFYTGKQIEIIDDDRFFTVRIPLL